jgi:hypothetical protein
MKNPELYVAGRARRWLGAGAMACLLLVSGAQATARDARVEAVQWPAWVVRNGNRFPVQAGEELQASDRLLTGRRARLTLRLSDGSAVKVGEQAEVGLDALSRKDGVLEAAIEVGKGAFRFTTGLFARVLGKREVQVKVSTLTIGVRGTDLWGKADGGGLVLLIEGRISVAQAGGEAQEIATPLEYVTAPSGQPAVRKTAEPVQVAEWAKETELDPARPVGRNAGRHAATIVVAENEAEALAMRETLRAEGYPVRLRPLEGERIALRVERLSSVREATALAAEAKSRLGAARP